MKRKNIYRPVKGSRQHNFLGGSSSLWLSDDHLLLVRNNGWKESYRKFYFRDTQALIIAETKQRRNQCTVLLLTTLFFLLMASLFREIGWVFYLPAAFIALTAFLINWFKGPTCTTHIITAVQTTPLPCKRLAVAQRLREELTGSIEKVQGHFNAEHGEKLDSRLQKISTADKQQANAADQAKQAQEQAGGLEKFTLFFDNRAHIITYILFLLLAVISVISLGGRGQLLYSLESILFLVTLIAVIVALYRQSRSRLKGMLVLLTWLAPACLVIAVLANFGLFFKAVAHAADVESMFSNEYELWMMLGRVQPADSLYLRVLLITRTACFTLLSITGLLFSFRANKVRTDA
jgi:hypothetical protein